MEEFCYIIISKESLDGASHQPSGNGAFQSFKENGAGKYRRRHAGPDGDAPVWNADRRKRFGNAGSLYVSALCGSKNHREKL